MVSYNIVIFVKSYFINLFFTLVGIFLLSGCSGFLPQSGPMSHQVYSNSVEVKSESIEPFLTVVDLNPKLVSVFGSSVKQSVSEFKVEKYSPKIGVGDVVEIIIQEQYPAVLFPLGEKSNSYIVPTQAVTENGQITIPYIGKVTAKGKTVEELSD